MPKKRNVDDVLKKDAVTNVHPETPTERIVRLLLGDIKSVSALVIIGLGLVGSIAIMIALPDLRTLAFQTFNTIVVGALGFFFGKASSSK